MTPRAPEASVRFAGGDGGIGVLITAVASIATAAIAVTGPTAVHRIEARPLEYLCFLGLTLALQLLAVEVYGRGSISVSGIGLLAVGFAFGAGVAMLTAMIAAVVHLVRRRSKGRLHRSIFNAASWALSAGLGAAVFAALTAPGSSPAMQIAPAVGAGLALWAANIGLVSLVFSLDEGRGFLAVWQEKFRWLTVHYVAFGPLALASTIAFDRVGFTGILAFALPPALLMITVRQYLSRTAEAIEEVRRANEELQSANVELEARNADLRDLFEFAGGLAAQAHDRVGLVDYAQTALTRLTGDEVRITVGLGDAGGDLLVAGGHPLGSVHVDESERWQRLRDAVVPQLATALESAALVERVRKTHLETIAALSRSMEAKDYYTGGHTERVATVAVALARRLGFQGADLDAVEIGALLHDIGKIGIPERILHKPGPLDDEEWKVMKEHPVISEYILAEVDLPPIVLQIARSSHERMDGAGYPDGVSGEEIPLAARIVLVADAFDALTSDRPYRRGRRMRDALEELRAHTGTQFCPRVMAALEQVYREEPHLLAGGELRAVDVA
ncbi:MAG TPA: HD-GYP domain-containing protein [Gaiellaceae bacterium]|nr:HD-GYP domain-containing protein [Gaiellaceae bacterium]